MDQALCPVLVGRQEELALLENALRTAAHGEGQFELVGGEAGAGKSRLVAGLVEQAESLGVAVVVGACSEIGLPLPYLPFVNGLRNHIAGSDREWASRLGDARRELVKLFPELDATPFPELDDPVRAKQRLFESIAALLCAIAGDAGVLLVLEDLHWADAATLELLDYLIHQASRERWMILATYRTDEVTRRHPLHPMLRAWSRVTNAQVIELQPLSAEMIGTMLEAVFDAAEAPDDLRDLLFRRCEGNPFVFEELLKDAIDEGAVAYKAGHWRIAELSRLELPQTVTDSILMRLDRLDEQQVEILRAGAVLGASFPHQALVHVAEVGDAEAHHALEAGIRQQIIEEDPASPAGAGYRFRHNLTREAVYNDILVHQRQSMHQRAAEALLARDGTPAAQIASHLLAAGATDFAVPMLLAAADEATTRHGHKEAADIYERVLPHVRTDSEQAEVLCRLGESLWRSGQPAEAERHLTRGVGLLESVGLLAETAHYTITLARCHWECSRLDLAHTAYERARELLVLLPPSPDLAAVYVGVAGLFAFELDGPKTQHFAELAIAVGGEVDARAPITRAYNLLGVALVYQGRIADGIAYLDRSYQEAARSDLDWNALTALYNAVVIRVWHMRAAECPPLLEKLLKLPDGHWRNLAYWRGCALVGHALGQLDATLAATGEVKRLCERGGASTFVHWARRQRAFALAESGRVREARDELPPRRDGEDRQELFFDYQARMRVHLDLGETQAAAELAAIVLAADDWAQDAVLIGGAAEAFVAAGQVAQARQLLRLAQLRGFDLDNPYMLTALARIDIRVGDNAAALPLLRRATADFARAGYRVEEIRCRLLLANAHRQRGEARHAREEIEHASRLATECGAAQLEKAARRMAKDMGFRVARQLAPAAAIAAGEPGPRERATIVGELRLAVQKEQFVMFFQPKLNLATRIIDAAEGLIRWQHPRHGLVYPDRFIEIAEKIGLIGAVTEWAVRAGLDQTVAWHEEGHAIHVSVNLSTADLENPRFPEMVELALSRSGVDPSRLCLEVTESRVMARPTRALRALHDLAALGIGLSIDDFGKGQSSLSYVRKLPVTELKIDSSFCLELDDRALVIVRSAIGMGHDLGMKVTAEGVESPDVVERLAALGCDHAQGYAIARPMPAAQMGRLIRPATRVDQHATASDVEVIAR